MAAKVYSISNQKGGVAKTVSYANLGIGLAHEGRRVLLVDIDPQGSLTASLGYPQPDQMEVTRSTLMAKIIADEPIEPGEGILHQREGVDLIPANIELSGMEVALVNTMSRETILREYLKLLKDSYDVIILDCTQSLGMLTINALAADEVLIPIQPQYWSIKGLEQLVRTIARVKRQIISGSCHRRDSDSMADMRTNYTKDIFICSVKLMAAESGFLNILSPCL